MRIEKVSIPRGLRSEEDLDFFWKEILTRAIDIKIILSRPVIK